MSYIKFNNKLLLMVFSGQVVRWNKKSLFLYYINKEFKKTMDLIDKKMNEKYLGYSIIEKALKLDELGIFENDQFFTHTMLFMYQVSLYSIYKNYKIKPNLIISISCGEIAALYASGICDLDTCCDLIYMRAKVLNETLDLNGKMMGIFCNKSIYDEKYSHLYKSFETSLYISPSSFVLSGSIHEIEDLSIRLKQDNIKFYCCNQGTRFHCSIQDSCKDEILSLDIKSNNPLIPLLSTSNMKYFNENYKFDSNHLFLNIRNPCYIQHSYEMVLNDYINSNQYNELIIVEISPKPLGTGDFILNDILPSINKDNENNIKDSIKIMSYLNENENYFNQLIKEINKENK